MSGDVISSLLDVPDHLSLVARAPPYFPTSGILESGSTWWRRKMDPYAMDQSIVMWEIHLRQIIGVQV